MDNHVGLYADTDGYLFDVDCFFTRVFPEIPHAIWIILLTATIVIPSILGVKFSAFTGKIFVIAQVIFVGVFWILTAKSLMAGVGAVQFSLFNLCSITTSNCL